MTDLERAGADLVRAVPDDPAPMDQLHQRVAQRRRRRVAVVTVCALIVGLGIGAVPLVGLLNAKGPTQLRVSGQQSQKPTNPAPTPTGTAPASGPAGSTGVPPSPSASPVPGVSAFAIVDSTWVSDTTGWVLGTANCTTPCAYVILATTDGGRSWSRVAAPPVTPPIQLTCSPCLHLRFATTQIGYAYGDSGLYLTTDGAQTWQRQPVPTQVEDLEIGGGTAYLVGDDGSGCPGPCAVRLESSPVGSTSWRQLAAPAISQGFGDAVSVQGSDIYLIAYGHTAGGSSDAQSKIDESTDAGATWQSLHDPCGPTPTGNGQEVDAEALAAAPGGFLAALCVPRSNPEGAVVVDRASVGAPFGAPLTVPVAAGAVLRGVAAGSASNLAVVVVLAGGPVDLMVSTDGGASWRTTLSLAIPAKGLVNFFLGYEDATTARFSLDDGTLWTTTDAGAMWRGSEPAP